MHGNLLCGVLTVSHVNETIAATRRLLASFSWFACTFLDSTSPSTWKAKGEQGGLHAVSMRGVGDLHAVEREVVTSSRRGDSDARCGLKSLEVARGRVLLPQWRATVGYGHRDAR